MLENGNNPSQPKFTDHEMEIIDQIIITIAILLDNCIQNYKKPEQIMNEYSEINSSKKGTEKDLLRVFTTLILRNINNEKGMSPKQIKEQITKISKELYKKSLEDFLANSSNLSKVLKEKEDAGILFSIAGKKKIKEQSPKSTPRKLKSGMYQEERPEGPPVIKKLTATAEDYKKILSNPEALDLINNNLIKYGKLEKAYNLIMNNALSLFKKGDEQTYNFLHTFKVSFPDVDTNAMPDPKLFQEAINSIGEQELEELRKQGVRFLLENPSTGVFFIFSLSKMVDST
jgi:hypothetical protein